MLYYQQHAQRFADATLHLDLGSLYATFLAHLPADSLILDAGCGAGRDARIFREQGHRVRAFDASLELCAIATAHLGEPVFHQQFDDITERACYDGMWACASLLHVPERALPATLARLWDALKPGGCFYSSFKLGDGERIDESGRLFTDATEERARAWLDGLQDLHEQRYWVTEDVRPDRGQAWLNILLRKQVALRNKLVTGGADAPFLPHLSTAIHRAREIDLAVAFIKETGLRELWPDLTAAIEREKAPGQRVRVRILTSDYLDVTDPEALRLLELLQQQGAEVRVFLTGAGSFHLKAYIFLHHEAGEGTAGTAFVGSSNLSRQALHDGLEWNYRIDYPQDSGFLEARNRFEELFRHPSTIALNPQWIADYARRRRLPALPVSPGSHEREAPPTPTPVQQAALDALDATRKAGHVRGLVVLATGLGKTWLAAFDARQMQAKQVLFLAHREEILSQAAATFLRIRPDASIGFFTGNRRDHAADCLFASVQTLARPNHLQTLDPRRYDYIVVDEFHHAAAETYQRILRHVRPAFLLGLTATPDRTDQSDILSLCDDNLVHQCDLFDGISANLLAPFHYYGILDETVDYQAIPWRNGRFDPDALDAQLVTQRRHQHTLSTWQRHRQRRTLAFCASRRHAEHVSAAFRSAGYRAAAVYGGSTMGRTEALDQLTRGDLDILFSVDLFSEGVDVPVVDTILMLRPTESKILFLQQLGRGLRKHADKQQLVVLDFIANHKRFLHKPAALLNCSLRHADLANHAVALQEGSLALPPGCQINLDLDFVDFLRALRKTDTRDAYRELRDLLGRRPTAAEFHRAGENLAELRLQFDHWFAFLDGEGDLTDTERQVVQAHGDFLREVETTAMTKSFKMVTLEAFQSLNGWEVPPTLERLAERAWQTLAERGNLSVDLPEAFHQTACATTPAWVSYWRSNPVAAWSGNAAGRRPFFKLQDGTFQASFGVDLAQRETFALLVQELIDYRLARYEQRPTASTNVASSAKVGGVSIARLQVPLFAKPPKPGATPTRYCTLRQELAAFTGPNDWIAPTQGRVSGSEPPYALYRPGADGASAESIAALSGLDLAFRADFLREEIAPLFGVTFNPGNWNAGHVVLEEAKAHVLLVTLNKQGKASEHRYHDRWIDERTFQWQTQNSVTPSNKRGQQILHHDAQGQTLHLFVRENKLNAHGKAAAFTYHGRVRYLSHEGSAPMTVILDLLD